MERMRISWVLLITSALFVKIFSLFAESVERYYSNGIYPYIADVQRLLFGWIPFSVGDIFYLIVILFVIVKSVGFIKKVVRKQLTREMLWNNIKRLVFVLLIVYTLFNVLWGLNYNRVPMAQQFNLPAKEYSTNELSSLVLLLTDSLNALDRASIRIGRTLEAKQVVFIKAARAYSFSSKKLPELLYEDRSIKPSLYSYPGNFLGFTGYYNPFSGEAQVNTTVPSFEWPFIACHEIGHQLGYAKEDEANFAGFLAAHNYPDPVFRYSAYFDMYSYARRELFARDSMAMKELFKRLRPEVKNDFILLRQFYKRYENPLEPLITRLYGQYLKANQQPQGIQRYNEVLALLMAYFKKSGTI